MPPGGVSVAAVTHPGAYLKLKECDTMEQIRACNNNVSVLRPTPEELKIIEALRDPNKKEQLLKIKEKS
jgi:hypothetical protein